MPYRRDAWRGHPYVLVYAVRAGRFCVVTVNIFGENIAKKRSGFDEAFPTRHDNGVIFMHE